MFIDEPDEEDEGTMTSGWSVVASTRPVALYTAAVGVCSTPHKRAGVSRKRKKKRKESIDFIGGAFDNSRLEEKEGGGRRLCVGCLVSLEGD